MTAEQERLYVRLMMAQWRFGPLLFTFDNLAMATELPVEEVQASWCPRLAMEFPLADGKIANPLIAANSKKTLETSRKRSQAATARHLPQEVVDKSTGEIQDAGKLTRTQSLRLMNKVIEVFKDDLKKH
jgi:hypothetical protein